MTERLFGEVVHEVETVVEEFLPKAGGMIDRHRQAEARRREAEKERENIDAKIEAPSYKAVKTAAQSPEVFSGTTFNIGSGLNAMILPLSKYRFRASIFLITPVGSGIVLCKDQGAALAGNGFTLPSGVVYVINTRAQIWALNPIANGQLVQVSVGSEIYAPEARI